MSPYELVFGHAPIEQQRFPAIAEELEARQVATEDPDRFALLEPVEALVGLLGPKQDGGPRGELYRAHARLVYHGFLHWRAGCPADALGRDEARALADGASPERPRGARAGDEANVRPALAGEPEAAADAPEAPADAPPPTPAGWVELPSTLFWATVPPSTIPEPVNGFFWAAPADELQVLYVTGMRADRPGFGTFDARASWSDPAFAEPLPARADGAAAFANLLPGGDLDGLLSIATPAEALALAARALRFLGWVPGPGDPDEPRLPA